MSTPPKRSQTKRERRVHLLGLGHVAFDAEALDGGGGLLRRLAIDVENGDGGALRGQSLGRRGADRAGAGHQRDLPGERLHHRALQLRLLEAPIFEREQIALGQRLVAADRLGVGHHLDRVLGEVGGDRRILGGAPEPEQADARDEHHARGAVELGLGVADSFILAGEIGVILGDELGHTYAESLRELIELAQPLAAGPRAVCSWCE